MSSFEVFLLFHSIHHFQSDCSIHNRRSVLSDSSIVSHREYMDLVLMLSELGFVKGIYQCLLALDGRRQLVKGHVAIKLYEVLLCHINYDGKNNC